MGLVSSTLPYSDEEEFPDIGEVTDEHGRRFLMRNPTINIQKTAVVRNSVNLRRKTLELIHQGNELYLIHFIFDALYDVEISISFCCVEQVCDNQETKYVPTKYETFQNIYPKGVNCKYVNEPSQAINLNVINVNDLKWNPNDDKTIPILITLRALGTKVPQTQFTFAYIQDIETSGKNNTLATHTNNTNNTKYKIIPYRQKIHFGNKGFDIQEIFGIEKSSSSVGQSKEKPVNDFLSGRECVICLTEERNTAILPCRHMCLCNLCANIVRLQNPKCPICREVVKGLLQIAIDNDTSQVE